MVTLFLVKAHVCILDISINTLIPLSFATTLFGLHFIYLISSIIPRKEKNAYFKILNLIL